MAVRIKSDHAAFDAEVPIALFQTPAGQSTLPGFLPTFWYDVAATGEQFLFVTPINSGELVSDATDPTPITAIVNWKLPSAR
jgi:hypothetical protein